MHQVLMPDFRFDSSEIETTAAGPEITLDLQPWPRDEEIPDESLKRARAIVVYKVKAMPDDWLERLVDCRLVVRAGVGFDGIDLEECGRRGIAVSNVPDYGTTDVADHAVTLVLSLVRGVPWYDHHLRNDPVGFFIPMMSAPSNRRLKGATVGIVGLGRIGTAVALRLKAFDTRVMFYDPHLPNGAELSFGFERARSLEELMSTVDILSIHTPLTDDTRGMIGRDALAFAKPNLMLVNTSRGPVVDLDALHEALMERRIQAAALDVLPQEPPEPDHPLLVAWSERAPELDGRILITPHVASAGPEAIRDTRIKAMEVARRFLVDGVLTNCVNAAYLQRP